MGKERSLQARRMIDKNLVGFGRNLSVPRNGWVRSIREALGMTREQMGARMASARFAKLGVSASAVQALERQEIRGCVTLDSLSRAAQALDCHLVYALVPNTSLEDTVAKRVEAIRQDAVVSTMRTMELEHQESGFDEDAVDADTLVGGSALWR